MPEEYIPVSGEKGVVYISEEVIAEIVETAIRETEGVVSLAGSLPGVVERFGLKSLSRGVGVAFVEGVVHIDAAIYAASGESVAGIGERAQKSAAAAVESMTGLNSVVNIHVAGVAFD